MEAKSLVYGLTGFFIGGLIVSVAATMSQESYTNNTSGSSDMMSMREMSDGLKNKRGDEFDEAFIALMIDHHQGAIDMAHLAKNNAKHSEIKRLASDIVSAQQREIAQMQLWQREWNYDAAEPLSNSHSAH